ncbi:MAG: thiamine phosphate synthase [Phycisphaerae bacterium]|nr:thiamine phosphate synthase [Phycisphaerae bacterium]
MGAIHRVLDANINRAAEGMRVLEDIARFVLNNKGLCESIKNCRHELRTHTPKTTSRDTKNDVGTTVSTLQEESRNSLHDVATAAGNRVAEALRVIEELLKLESQQNSTETIRYTMYDLSAEVIGLLGATKKQQWKLCFVMTKNDCVLAWKDTLTQSIVAGCDCIQVREKEISTQDLIKHVQEVKEIADVYGVQVVVNDRVDVALATKVAGVHLGEEDMPIQDARKLCGPEYIIGATVHDPEKISEFISCGADYVGVGAMFASQTKPNVQIAPLGLLKNAIAYNHLAVGGITPKNVQQLYRVGCKGVAVSSAIANADYPDKVVMSILHTEHQST